MRVLLPILAVLCPTTATAQQPPSRIVVEREFVVRTGSSRCLAWSHDGKWMASGGECGDVLLMDAATGKVVHELLADERSIGALRFSPDDSLLAIAGTMLSVRGVADGTDQFREPVGSPTALDWSQDGKLLAVSTRSGAIALLSGSSEHVGRSEALLKPPTQHVTGLAFSPDGTRLVVTGRDGAWVFDVGTGRVLETLARGFGRHCAWPDEDRLLGVDEGGLSAARGHGLCLAWDDRRVRAIGGSTTFVVDGSGPCAVAPDGDLWACACDAGRSSHADGRCRIAQRARRSC